MASLIGRIVKGALAGAVGTLTMDAIRYARSRQDGSDQSFVEWEAVSAESFDEAPAPGKVAQIATDKMGIELPDESAGAVSNLMHWMTGMGYGVGHALINDGRSGALTGALTGVGAFANSYATLGAIGLYDPIWEYEPKQLAQDLAGHLAFGVATGLAYKVLDGSH